MFVRPYGWALWENMQHALDRRFNAIFHYIFFFQAEDGIRDGRVTGVQTCALPISRAYAECLAAVPGEVGLLIEGTAGAGTALGSTFEELRALRDGLPAGAQARVGFCLDTAHLHAAGRSEERRVGKGGVVRVARGGG